MIPKIYYPKRDIHVSSTISSINCVILGICPVNKTIPIVTIMTPPTFMMTPLFCTIHFVEPRKNVNSKNGTEKPDRKSTRLNSSHVAISYAVFCLKKKKKENKQ